MVWAKLRGQQSDWTGGRSTCSSRQGLSSPSAPTAGCLAACGTVVPRVDAGACIQPCLCRFRFTTLAQPEPPRSCVLISKIGMIVHTYWIACLCGSTQNGNLHTHLYLLCSRMTQHLRAHPLLMADFLGLGKEQRERWRGKPARLWVTHGADRPQVTSDIWSRDSDS